MQHMERVFKKNIPQKPLEADLFLLSEKKQKNVFSKPYDEKNSTCPEPLFSRGTLDPDADNLKLKW